MNATVILQDAFIIESEKTTVDETVKNEKGDYVRMPIERTVLLVHQKGKKENIKVIAPIDTDYEVGETYDFTGNIISGFMNGKEWVKLVLETK